MDIRCERCQALYRFKDDQIGPAGIAVRCSKCGHVFRVKRPAPAEPAAAEPAAAPSPGQGGGWSLRKRRGGSVYAVRDAAVLQKWVLERRAIRDDEASYQGGPWRRLGDMPELQELFATVDARRRAAAAAKPAASTLIEYPGARSEPVFPGPGLPSAAAARTEIAYQLPGEPAGADRPAAGGPDEAWTAPDAPAGPAEPAWTGAREGAAARADAPAPAAQAPAPPVEGLPGLSLSGPRPEKGGAPAAAPAISDEAPVGRSALEPSSPLPIVVVILVAALAIAGAVLAWLRPDWLGFSAPEAPETPFAKPFGGPPAPPAPMPAPATEPAPAPPPPAAPAAAPAEHAAPAPGGAAPAPARPPEPSKEPWEAVEPAAPRPSDEAPAPRPTEKPSSRAGTTVKSLLAAGRTARNRGDTARALDAYNQVLERDAKNADALAGRGHAYLEAGQSQQAEENFQAALAQKPQHPDALLGLADTYRYESRAADARRYYRMYLAAHPRGAGATAAKNALAALPE